MDDAIAERGLIDEATLNQKIAELRDWLEPELAEIDGRLGDLTDDLAALEARVKALEEEPDVITGMLATDFVAVASGANAAGLVDAVELANSYDIWLEFYKRINSKTSVGIVLWENDNALPVDQTFTVPDQAWVRVDDTEVFGADVDLTIGRQYVGYAEGLTFDNDSRSTDGIRAQFTDTALDELEFYFAGGMNTRPHFVARLANYDDPDDADDDLWGGGVTWIWNDLDGYGGTDAGEQFGRLGVDVKYMWDAQDGEGIRAEVTTPLNNLGLNNLAWYVAADVLRDEDWDISLSYAQLPLGANPSARSGRNADLTTPYLFSYNEAPFAMGGVPGTAYRPGFWFQRTNSKIPAVYGENAAWADIVYHSGSRDWRFRLINEADGVNSRWTAIAGTDISIHGDFDVTVDLGLTQFSGVGGASQVGAMARGSVNWYF